MVRLARMEHPGVIYHVIQRGNNRENVFESPEWKNYFIGLLGKFVGRDWIDLYAYVVMGNHYHLALRTRGETLSKIMHRINTAYSMYYNREKQRTGHVFQGRFKSVPVLDDRYLIALVKYIHSNPIRSGNCKKMREYTWSSDGSYRSGKPGIVETGFLLDMLSMDRRKAIIKYNQLMEQDDNVSFKDLEKKDKDRTEIRSQINKPAVPGKTLDEILKQTGVNEEEFQLIREGSRLRKLTGAKTAYAKSAWANGYTLGQIATYIGVSSVAVLKYINRP